MNKKYFANPELSNLLSKNGVSSQPKFVWAKEEGKEDLVLTYWDYYNSYLDLSSVKVLGPAFHWSDICIPENACKIWSGTYYGDIGPEPEFLEKTKFLLFHVQQPDSRWQSWLMSELTKQK